MSIGKSRVRWMLGLSLGAAVATAAALGLREPVQQTAVLPSTLTVVGFAVVNMTEATAFPPPQLQLNFQEAEPTIQGAMNSLHKAMAAVTARLKKAGVKADAISTQGPPNVNDQNGDWQVDATIQVNFSSFAHLEKVTDETGVANDAAIQNVWINNSVSNVKATPAALAQGYARAVHNAETTAAAIANADGRQLGAQLSVYQGAGSTQCGAMACGAGASLGINPPQLSANQELVAVTATFATKP